MLEQACLFKEAHWPYCRLRTELKAQEVHLSRSISSLAAVLASQLGLKVVGALDGRQQRLHHAWQLRGLPAQALCHLLLSPCAG